MEDRYRSIWLCRRTTLEMLKDRGYDVNIEDISLSLDEFKKAYSNIHLSLKPLERLFTKKDSVLLLHFLEEPKLNVKNIKTVLETARLQAATSLLIIIRESMSSQVKEEIRSNKNVDIEVFKEADLMFNVTKHELVPLHEIKNGDWKLRFLAKYKLKETELPQISIDDPVVRYLRGKKGDLVKIIRKCEVNEDSAYHKRGNGDDVTIGPGEYCRIIV